MKKEDKEVRKHFVKTRMNDEELKQVTGFQKKTTEKDLSNYLRKVLLKEPVAVTYGNSSADEFLKEMLLLRKELNAVGNNFNQAVHKLHLLDKIPEFRSWLERYDGLVKLIESRTGDIILKVNGLYHQWLQK